MKRIAKITSWVLFLVGAIVLLAFADSNYDKIDCDSPVIIVDKSTGHDFVTKAMVVQRMNDIGYNFNGQSLGDIDVNRIERDLLNMPGVKSVEAYKSTDGVITIEVQQRRPIARVISKNGSVSYYVDSEGNVMPLSKDYVAKVPVFNGEIGDARVCESVSLIEQVDSLAETCMLDDIFRVAKALDKDEFMTAQIVQVYINKQHEMELIPRVGNQRILFGDASDANLKVKKLNKFYTETIPPKELNLYDTINVKYVNQIICSKK